MRTGSIFASAAAALALFCSQPAEAAEPALGTGYGTQFEGMAYPVGNRKENVERFYFFENDVKGDRIYGDLLRLWHTDNGDGETFNAGANVPLDFGKQEERFRGNLHLYGQEGDAGSGYGMKAFGTIGEFLPLHLLVKAEGLDRLNGDDSMLVGGDIGVTLGSSFGWTTLVPGYHELEGKGIVTFYGLHRLPDQQHSLGVGFRSEEGGGDKVLFSVGRETLVSFKGIAWRLSGSTDFSGSSSAEIVFVYRPERDLQYKPNGLVNYVDGLTDIKLVTDPMNFPPVVVTDRGSGGVLVASQDWKPSENKSSIYALAYPFSLADSSIAGWFNPYLDVGVDKTEGSRPTMRGGGGIIFSPWGGLYSTTGSFPMLQLGFEAVENGKGSFYGQLFGRLRLQF